MTGLLGLLLFAVLAGALVLLWRWAADVSRTAGPGGDSEQLDGYRHNGG
ncbi:MAG: hypothetical protein AAGA90_22535 [Actinomycetota bacterium]